MASNFGRTQEPVNAPSSASIDSGTITVDSGTVSIDNGGSVVSSTNTSVIEYDTAGTTITGGQSIDFGTLGATGSASERGTQITDIILLPGETLTLAVRATQSTTDATAAIRWVEDL